MRGKLLKLSGLILTTMSMLIVTSAEAQSDPIKRIRDIAREKANNSQPNKGQDTQKQKVYSQITIDPRSKENKPHKSITGSLNFHNFKDAEAAIQAAPVGVTITFFEVGGEPDYVLDTIVVTKSMTIKSPSGADEDIQLSFPGQCIEYKAKERFSSLTIKGLTLISAGDADSCIKSARDLLTLQNVNLYVAKPNTNAIHARAGRVKFSGTADRKAVILSDASNSVGSGILIDKEAELELTNAAVVGFNSGVVAIGGENHIVNSKIMENHVGVTLKNESRRLGENDAPSLTIQNSQFEENAIGISANEGFEKIVIDGETTSFSGSVEDGVAIEFEQKNGPSELTADISKIENFKAGFRIGGNLKRDTVNVNVKTAHNIGTQIMPSNHVCSNIRAILNEIIRFEKSTLDKREAKRWKKQNSC